jgi:enterochelin esterase-like enzyme/dienelactone hydrolase
MRNFYLRTQGRRLAVVASILASCWHLTGRFAVAANSAPQEVGASYTYTPDTPIDPEHAQPLMQKARSGAPLTADEWAYLERVRQVLQKQRAERGGVGGPPPEFGGRAAATNGWQRLPDGSYGKEVEYTGVGGISLPGYVRKPEGSGPFPAIVYLHGGGAYPQGGAALARQGRTSSSPLADFLKAGWVVYAIDYRPTDSPVVSVLDAREIEDSVAAVEALRRLPFVDPERLGFVGCSHGAQLCTRLISRAKLKGAVICAPACFELPETKAAIARGAKVNVLVRRIIAAAEQKYGAPLEEVAKDPAKYGYASAVTEVAGVKCPVLFINGKNDDNSLYSVVGLYAGKLRAAGIETETYFPDNGPHGFYSGRPNIPEYKESTRLTVDFFKQQFGHDTTAANSMQAQSFSAPNDLQITSPKATPYSGPPIVYRYPPRDNWNTPHAAMMSFVDPIREAPPGTTYETVHSKTINGEVSYLVALPPGYDQDPAARYPVLYYLGASGATPKREALGVQAFVDKAIQTKAALPFIVIYSPGLCGNTMYCDSRDGNYPLETVLTQDLIPHVDATYRTIPSRDARGVEGFSMGGFGAAHLGFKFPELFGVISIKAPPLIEPDSQWRQVRQAWGNLFPTAMANDMEYFGANDPFTLVAQNAAKLRDHTCIRLITHVLTGENWIQARVEALHQALLKNGIPHDYHVYDSVKTHNPTAVFNCQGDGAFSFFNTIPAQMRHGAADKTPEAISR